MKSSYLFEDCGTDRRTESISECSIKDLSNDMIINVMPTKAEN